MISYETSRQKLFKIVILYSIYTKMKKIYLLCDSDWLQEIAKTKKELRKSFFENWKTRRNWLKAKEYTIREIEYDDKKYDYDWWYGDFWIFEKNKVLENWNVDEFIEYDDYSKYWIVQKELKKDFLYLKTR